MATYYVNPTTGNDGNPGTEGSPKRTVQTLFDDTTLNPGDIVEIQAGTHNLGAFTMLLFLTNYKRGNAGNYITVQGAPGCIINTGSSGIEGYGSCRFLRFKNLVMNIDTGGFFNEGIFFNGRNTDKTGNGGTADGQGFAHIEVDGCTIKGASGGYLGRNVIGMLGGDYINIHDCDLSFGAENDFGGGGSGVSLHQPYSYDTTPGIHVRCERNKIYRMGNPATANDATDRNGIILDQYHQTGGFGGPLIDHRLVGDTLIANNIIVNCAGRGIHVLLGGVADSKIGIINNTIVAPFGYALGGSIPQCGIGGYGQGMFDNITFFNNLVIGNQQRFNYAWHNFDAHANSVVGSRNWSYNGNNLWDPGSTEPSGWLFGTANPLLVNPLDTGLGNYAPQAGSPLIGAGVASFNGWAAPTLDFNKATRTSTPTIGAIQVNSGAGAAPVANFTFAPALPGAGSQVTFTDTSTGAPNSFFWDFGDGTTSTQTNPVKIYAAQGTYTVSHTVSNAFGANTKTASITIAASGTGGGGSTPGTPVDLFAMFNQRYPCAANLIWVDANAGNDSNPGSQAAPKQSLQAAVNIAQPGNRIMLRAGTYGVTNLSGKSGTANNWIQIVGQTGAILHANGDGQGGLQVKGGASFWAVYGVEFTGHNNGGDAVFEVGIYMQESAHHFAAWNCHGHHMSSHFFASNGAGCADICYNRLHHLAQWNFFQTSAISFIAQPNVGSTWPDGYWNHVIGNIIDAVWEDPSIRSSSPWGLTDGNGIILDYSAGFAGRTLCAHNLIVGTSGRGIHTLGTDHVDAYLNTTGDTCLDLDGTWKGALSITDSDDCHFEWNVAWAEPSQNRVGIAQNIGSGFWGNNVFVRGTGGSEANDPSVNANGNVNKTGVGPSGYFQQYQQGQLAATSITNPAGFRPVQAQVATFTPSTALRNLIAPWPDPLLFLRPATGAWAYGAFEASTSTAPGGGGGTDPGGGGGGTDPPPPPASGALTVEAESGTVEGGSTIMSENPGFLGTGYIGFFGVTGDANQVNINIAAAGTYAFRIRYGNAHQPAQPCNVDLRVNGTVVATIPLNTTSSSWSDSTRFQFSTPVNISLVTGANVIRIEHTGADYSYADLDQYVFESQSTNPPGGGGGEEPPTGNAPVANFAFSPTAPLVGQSTSFVDQSVNTPTSWAWNFGDGTTSTQQNPTKTYAAAGTYSVTLTATNALGSNSITRNITVVNVVGTAVTVQHQVTGQPLQNSTSYIVTVEVRDAQGLSASDNEDFSTSWSAPTAPAFTVNP